MSKDKVQVRIYPRGDVSEGDFNPDIPISEIPVYGGWTDDPGVGKAVLLEDGREVLNPLPVAPPLGYKQEPTMMEMVDAMVKKHLAGLKDDEEVDTLEDAQDFEMSDEFEPYSPYDVMYDEFPAVPPVKEEVLDKEEEAPLEPPPDKKKPAKKPVSDKVDEGE